MILPCRLAGSYEALEAGNPSEALVDFTGGVSESIDLVSGNYANDLEKRKLLFQKLYKYMDRQSLTSASIKVGLLVKFRFLAILRGLSNGSHSVIGHPTLLTPTFNDKQSRNLSYYHMRDMSLPGFLQHSQKNRNT